MDTLVKKDLSQAIARRLGVEEAQVESFLDATIGVIQDELIRGRQITLKDFATLRVVEEKARIVKDPDSGDQVVRPIQRLVSIRPSKIFQDRIEKAKLSAILLAVPRDSVFSQVVEYHFQRAGWKVYVTHDPNKVRETVWESGAYLVVLDMSLEDADALVRDLKCEPKTNSIPVVSLFPKGMDPERPADLRVRADESLTDPFDIQSLLALAESLLSQAAEEQAFFLQQVSFTFPTDELFLEEASDVGMNLFSDSGLPEDAQVAMGAAFREAMGNAAQHGNRHNPAKMVRVHYYLDPSRVTAVVTDEGQGFNHAYYTQRGEGSSALVAARERHRQGRIGGLGIMLMMRCTDRLQYNDVGNSVTLTRHLHRVGAS